MSRSFVAARRSRREAPTSALYHVGNNPEAHGWIVDALRRRPGVVVLHDFVLHHLVAGLTLGRGDNGGLPRRNAAGLRGDRQAARSRRRRPPATADLGGARRGLPSRVAILDHADGVICHSKYVERLAREYGYAGPIRVIPMPAWASVETGERLLPRDRLPVFVCCGYLNAAKRIPQLLAPSSASIAASRTRCSSWREPRLPASKWTRPVSVTAS